MIEDRIMKKASHNILDNYRFLFLRIFVGIGTGLLLFLTIYSWLVGNYGSFFLDLIGLGFAAISIITLIWGSLALNYFILALAHFTIATMLLWPEMIQNGNMGMGNHVLAYTQLTLFLGIGAGLAPSMRAWVLFVIGTIALVCGDFIFTQPEHLSNEQILSLTYYFILAIVVSWVLLQLLKRFHERLNSELIRSHTCDEEKAQDALAFVRLGHDLRSPMTMALYAIDSLELTTLSADQREMVHLLKESQKVLLDDLDFYLKGHLPEKWNEKSGDMDLGTFAKKLMSLYEPGARRKHLKLTYEGPEVGDYPPVMVSQYILRHLLSNLLSNSVKFTTTGSVTLIIKPESQTVTFTVVDTGPGLPEKSTVHEEKGYGLGLGIVKNLARLMKSDLKIHTGPQGTVITVVVPISKTNQNEE